MSAAVIDIVIIAILGISVVYGIYHGFLQSVLSVVCCIASFFIAAQAAPAVTGLLMNNSTVTSFLSTGTDALGQVSDYQLASQQVSGPVDQSLVDLVLANVDLPEPVEKLIGENLRTGAFASLHINTVNEYVQRTIITTALNVICYILCFAVSYFVLALLGSLLKHVFDFPLLKMLDWLCGGFWDNFPVF